MRLTRTASLRFDREAKVLASLNHANIAALFGMEAAGQQLLLVMELVEGETLAERIARGAIVIEDALPIARQIAEALEAAHEQGVVHRDLKPANVKITRDDKVKVLDFGLAKAMETAPAAANVTNSPTLSMMASQAGIVLGTAAYMSPEQAKGLPVDQRSDVFSFGVVFFEMLTGRQPFRGETVPDILASVLAREPELTHLPNDLNPRVAELLRRCLDKAPKKRWQAIGDVRAELETIAASPRASSLGAIAAPRLPLWRRAIPVLGGIAISAAVTSAAWWFGTRPSADPIVRFSQLLEQDQNFAGLGRNALAISPDGTRVVYLAGDVAPAFYLRALDSTGVRLIPGTVGAGNSPVFSPDGQWLTFWSPAESALKKVATSGGTAITLAHVEAPRGISWDGEWIVFAHAKGIMRVAANGGQPEVIAPIDSSKVAYGPQLVDDGRSILYTLANLTGDDRWDTADIILQSVGTEEKHTLVHGGSAARLLGSGHLVYAVGSTLLAVGFDLSTKQLTGGPVPVVEGVMRAANLATGAAQFAVSDNGVLAYIPGSGNPTERTIAVLDRSGVRRQLAAPPRAYQHPRLSPDEKQLTLMTDDGKEGIVWIYELAGSGPPRRLTFGGRNVFPIWSPDGKTITFQSDREGDHGIWRQPADGSGTAERVTKAEGADIHVPRSWTPDGTTLAYTVQSGSLSAIWTTMSAAGSTPKLFVSDSKASYTAPAFSPDGRWLAYGSTDASPTAYFVFVQPYPPTGAKLPNHDNGDIDAGLGRGRPTLVLRLRGSTVVFGYSYR